MLVLQTCTAPIKQLLLVCILEASTTRICSLLLVLVQDYSIITRSSGAHTCLLMNAYLTMGLLIKICLVRDDCRAPSRQWQGASCRRARWRWASPPSWPRRLTAGPVRYRRRDVPRTHTRRNYARPYPPAFRTSCVPPHFVLYFSSIFLTAWGRAGRLSFV